MDPAVWFIIGSLVIGMVFNKTGLTRRMAYLMLLLMGEHEVIYDPARALARARRLIPHFVGELVPQSSHDMCFSQHRIVDRRILDFLKERRANGKDHTSERFVA
jgi:hypothetical protein